MNAQVKNVAHHTFDNTIIADNHNYLQCFGEYIRDSSTESVGRSRMYAKMLLSNMFSNDYEELSHRLTLSLSTMDSSTPTFGTMSRMIKLVDGVSPKAIPEWAKKMLCNEEKMRKSGIRHEWQELQARIKEYEARIKLV